MSPRNKKLRKVSAPPPIKGFKPFGGNKSAISNSDSIVLSFEEYEAMRLCDYEMQNHHQASVAMGVSRPTFTRIYASVRKKVARAFVEAKKLSIEGGKIYYDSDWYECASCHCLFNNPDKDLEVGQCALCGKTSVHPFSPGDNKKEYTLQTCQTLTNRRHSANC